MLRRRVALPAFVGLSGVIWAGAHALAHDVVARPDAASGHAAHEGTLESYVAYLPTSLALCATLTLALAAGAAFGCRWTGTPGRSLWLFGVVPVLGFAADTVVELQPHGHPTLSGTAVIGAELAPAFLVGLFVQIPFAFVLAARILWLVEKLVSGLFGPRGAAVVGERRRYPWGRQAHAPAPHIVSSRRSRAPPAALAA